MVVHAAVKGIVGDTEEKHAGIIQIAELLTSLILVSFLLVCESVVGRNRPPQKKSYRQKKVFTSYFHDHALREGIICFLT